MVELLPQLKKMESKTKTFRDNHESNNNNRNGFPLRRLESIPSFAPLSRRLFNSQHTRP